MTRWAPIAGGAALLIGGAFVAGRYAAPTKTVTTEHVVTRTVVDQESIAKAVAFAQAEWKRDVETKTTVRTVYKDGRPVERIVYRDHEAHASGASSSSAATSSSSATHTATEATRDTTKTVESARSRYALRFGAEWDALQPRPSAYVPGADVRLAGPLWATVEGRWRGSPTPEAVTLGLRLELP